jgi:hypothetical protein
LFIDSHDITTFAEFPSPFLEDYLHEMKSDAPGTVRDLIELLIRRWFSPKSPLSAAVQAVAAISGVFKKPEFQAMIFKTIGLE